MIIKVKKRKKIRQIIRKVLEKRKERVDYRERDENIKERKQNEPKARNTK
jgi:hypothetical protein